MSDGGQGSLRKTTLAANGLLPPLSGCGVDDGIDRLRHRRLLMKLAAAFVSWLAVHFLHASNRGEIFVEMWIHDQTLLGDRIALMM